MAVTRRTSPSSNRYDDGDDDDDNTNEDDAALNARFRAMGAKLRLGSEAAGSLSRIETTRVNLDGIKVFVPKVS